MSSPNFNSLINEFQIIRKAPFLDELGRIFIFPDNLNSIILLSYPAKGDKTPTS
jgi:hypothetical protein